MTTVDQLTIRVARSGVTYLHAFNIGEHHLFRTRCRRAAATVRPRPSPPRGRRSALRRRADGNVAVVSPRPTRSHAHRCSCLTRQHGGDLDL